MQSTSELGLVCHAFGESAGDEAPSSKLTNELMNSCNPRSLVELLVKRALGPSSRRPRLETSSAAEVDRATS